MTATLTSSHDLEVDSAFDSVVFDDVLLGNHSAVAVVWGDLGHSVFKLTFASVGGTLSSTVGLPFPAGDLYSKIHIAAVGQDRIVVVNDRGDEFAPGAAFTIYDSTGTQIKAATTIGGANFKHFDVMDLGDSTFLVKWTDGSSNVFYTRYNQDGTVKTTTRSVSLLASESNSAQVSFAGDGTGGFMYSTMASSSDLAAGSFLKYVDKNGTELASFVNPAGHRGTLAYQGGAFYYFYSTYVNNQIYMQKVTVTGSTVAFSGSAVTITGFSSTSTPIVKALTNGGFVLQDRLQTEAFIVNAAGGVVDSYIAPTGTASNYGAAAPSPDGGAVWVENYPLNSTVSTSKYDLKIGDIDSVFLVPGPTVSTPGALGLVDTTINDTFSATTAATVSATSSVALTYGIQGGTTGGSHTISGVNYDVSKAGSYGTLYLQSSTGKYSYEPNSTAINQLQANTSEAFTLTAANAAGANDSAVLTVNLTGVDDLPVIANLNGNTKQFTAGASNPVTDGANIAPGTVGVTDVDSSNFNSGYVQINQTSGATDGYFFTDVTRVKAGTTPAGADARFTAGETVYVDTSGTGTNFVPIGTVAASGGVLHIDFNASATATTVTTLLKYLTYGAPSTGSRSFTLQVNDGVVGGSSAASTFTMNGVDLTPPTISSSTPADNATGVALGTSPQITFSEAVNFGTGKIYLVDASNSSVIEQFDVATAQGTADGKVSIAGNTLTINPTAPLDYSKAYAIKIDSGAITDIAGNAFAGITNTTTLNFTAINNPPTVTISAVPTSLHAGGHATITFTFSAPPVGFAAADIDVLGGLITGLAVDPVDNKVYTADFSPSASQSLSATIQIGAGKFTNAASDANLASNVLALSGDTLAPTIASIVRSAPASSPTNADSLTFLVTFSESVANVDASDFSVTGSTATVSSVSPAGGNTYSVTVSGGDLASLNGTVGLSVTGGSDIADTATNSLSGTTPTGLNQTYVVDNDAAAPTFALAADTGSSNSDGVTANGTVNVTLATDVASWQYSVDGGAHWTTGTGASFTLAEGSYASGAIQVTQVDTAGNASAATSSTSAITVDTTANAPAFGLASDTGSSSSDNISANGTVNVTLPTDTASWEYSIDGGAHWSAGAGTTFTLGEGTYVTGDVKVRYIDTAGNPSTASGNAAAITIDTTATQPGVTLPADVGASSSDGITKNAAVSVTLAADTASWKYSVDGGAHWTAGTGTSFTLAEGTYASAAIQVEQTDTAGNTGHVTANASALTVDTTANAPAFALTSDTGSSSSDGITNDGALAVTLPGDAASWEYSTDGGAHWTAGTGTSFTLTVADFTGGAVKVRYTDTAGNLSASASNASAITVDTSAPAAAISLDVDTGASNSDGVTNNPTVNVTLPADVASWQYSVNGGTDWTSGSGTSFDLAEGQYASGDIKVRYTDVAGNASPVTGNADAITVDNTVAAPSLALVADSGSSSSDGITSNGGVNVTLASDVASWQYSTDGGTSWSTGSGTSFTLAAAAYAANAVQVRQTDIAGNQSAAASIGTAITVDQSAPAPALALAQDTGASGSDGITNNGVVNVTLPSDADTWEYSIDGGSHWTSSTGSSFSLTEGSYASGSIKVRYTDLAGNLSTAGSNAAAIAVDASVTAPALALHADTGTSSSDGITNDKAVNVTLAADAASWEYSSDGGAHWTAGTGTSFTLNDGSYAAGAIQVRQTDIAGNVSAPAANTSLVTIDTAAAAASFALAADTGANGSDSVTMDGTVSVTLPADAASWEFSTDSGAHWSAGTASTFTLAEGSYITGAVQVRYVDTAGNASAASSNAAAIKVDRTVAAPSLALAADTGTSSSDGLTNNPSVNVTLASDAASWEFSADGGAHWSAGTGSSFMLADGVYAAGAVKVRQTDLAGNLSDAGANASTIEIDTATPAPALALASDTGTSSSDGITATGIVNITLPTDAASWEFSTDGGAHWSAGSGSSFTLAEGSYAANKVQVRYTDNAGTVGAPAANTDAIAVDHTVAAPALALAADTGSSASDGLTNNTQVNVTLATDVASWEYSLDAGAHWTTGAGTSFTLADGVYAAGAVQVRQTDLAGNLSAAGASTASITIDTAAAAPTFALAVDSGRSATDGISTNGAINVTLPADAVTWEYSVDGGSHWSAGSATSFSLAEGSYANGAVQVRYTDRAGNLSAAAGNTAPISIDNTAAAPALALETDTGTAGDGITFDPNIRVTLPADAASWEYSRDNGAHWNTGTGTVFALTPGKYVTGLLHVRYTDLAGNHSAEATNASEYKIEQVDAPPPVPVSVDGVPVTVGTVNNPDGSTSQVITVPVVLPTRVDDSGSPTVANIPLVSGSNGAPPPLAAQVPTGFGLQVTGSPTGLTPAAGLNELLREIQSHTTGGSSDQGSLSASGSGFLSQLSPATPLLVQSVTPTIGVGAPPGSPLVISAPPATPNGPVTALVIDASNLPTGTNIELQNVDFAALIGPMRVTGGDGQQTVFGDGASQYIVLGPDDDILHGGAGDDIVGSEGGNDKIYGDEGNDLVFGGAGNDYIDGGSGTDTVLLQGTSRADYSLRFDHGNLVATQLHGGPDGTDTIANVELLRFAGAGADMGAQGALRRVYDTLFDRPADAAGASFWAGMNAKGMSMHDIAASLLGAAEASALAKLSNAAFVDQLYLDALGAQPVKPASSDERASWVAMLDQGKTDRAGVLVGIANSTQKLSLDAQEQSQVAFADTDAATVVRLYDTVFGRLGDEAGVNYWIGRSEAHVAMKDIVNAFLLSAEGQQHYGNTGDDQFVDALYNVGLGRHADAAEISWWSDKLHTGVLSRSDMVLYFADSPEKVALIGHSTTIPGL